jgi:hypothetical protein
MRVGRFVPWLMVTATALGGAGIGPVLAQNAIKEPGWPPPEGAACKPKQSEIDEAKTLFTLGENAYKTSNYTDAIKYWKDGYKRACGNHIFLKNLGKALEADGQWAAAIEVYQLFRARAKPTGEELDLLDAKIMNLQKKVGVTPTSTAPTGTATAAPTGTATGAPTTAPTGTATAAPTGTATGAPTTPPPSGPSKALPLGLMIGGGVVAVGGGVLWGIENGKVKTASNDWKTNNCASGANHDVCEGIASDGNSAKSNRTIGVVMTGVGVAAAAVGVTLFVLGGDKDKKKGEIVLTPGPGFAGVGVAGSF